MQGIFRKLATLSLASAAMAGSLFGVSNSALALTEQEILDKLNGIPVFLIVNDQGQSLTANVATEDESNVQVPIVFINSVEAESFLARAEREQAELSDEMQIAVLPLSDVYAEATEQLESPNSLVYVPSAESVDQATQIVNREIQGVPLYAAVDLEEEQYLLTGENTLPMFFSLQDLQSQISALLQSNPELEDAIGVEVTTFESVLFNMASDDPDVNQIMSLIQFVPSSQTMNYLNSLSNQNPAE
jgi:nickel transport protein